MSFRKILFWAHLTIGVIAGVIIFVMAATGALLAYERQIGDLEVAANEVEVPLGGSRYSEADLLELVNSTLDEGVKVAAMTVFAEPNLPVKVSTSKRQTLFVDPYTGEIAGESDVEPLFGFIEGVHRTLALHAADMWDQGRAVTGVANVVFLMLLFSGIYLWLPRRWTRRAVRAVIWFNGSKRAQQRDWNWHHVLGFWSAPVLLVIIVSGVFISYHGLYDVLEGTIGEGEQAKTAKKSRGVKRAKQAKQATDADADETHRSLDEMWTVARSERACWKAIQMRYPGRRSPNLQFNIRCKPAGYVDSWARLEMDPKTGARVGLRTFEDRSTIGKLRSWMRWGHTGEAFGPVGQTLALIASLATLVLVWTGLALALRRLQRWRRRNGRS